MVSFETPCAGLSAWDVEFMHMFERPKYTVRIWFDWMLATAEEEEGILFGN